MIIFGRLNDVRKVPTKKGAGVIIEIAQRGKWDSAKKQFGPEEILGVWYFDNRHGEFATWAEERKAAIGKNVVLAARNSGKELVGTLLPKTYGIVHDMARIKEDISDEQMAASIDAIEECIAAEELPAETDVAFDNAESVASVISVLRASNSEVAKTAVIALSALITPETNAYLGKIWSKDTYQGVVKVAFITPNTKPAEWNNVSFFGDVATRAEKVLEKGDEVFITMGTKSLYNGKPSYRGFNFIKL